MTAVKGNITQIGANSFQIKAGQQAYEPPATVETKSMTVTFGAGSANAHEIIRVGFAANIDLSATDTVNVATIAYTLNGSTVTGTQAIAVGDILKVEVTRTAGGSMASATLYFDYDSDTELVSAADYFWSSWTNLTNVIANAADFEQTVHGLTAQGGGAAINYDLRGAYSVESFSGTFTIEVDRLDNYSMIGLKTANSGAIDGSALLYGIFNNGGDLNTREGGSGTAFNTTNGRFAATAVRIIDTGTAIQYWYRYQGGAWTLLSASGQPYTPGRVYYLAWISGIEGNKLAGVKIYP